MSAPEVHGLVRLEISKSDYQTANQTRASEQRAGEHYSCPPHLRMRHHIHERRLALARLSEDRHEVACLLRAIPVSLMIAAVECT